MSSTSGELPASQHRKHLGLLVWQGYVFFPYGVSINQVCPYDFSGKKQDIWYVIDLLTGEKQQTLSSAFADSLCPSTSLLYLGRTGKKGPSLVYNLSVSKAASPWVSAALGFTL